MKTVFNIWKFAVPCFVFAGLTACTDVETVEIKTPGLEETDPALYQRYIEGLNDYKKSDHKVAYAWFDNKEKKPFSRGQHVSDVPDSLDVIVMKYPQNLADFELQDMASVRVKGTKVAYSISFDEIRKNYLDGVDAGEVTETFETYLKAQTSQMLGYAESFDGIIIAYKGTNPIYMSEAQRAEVQVWQNAFFSLISEWKSSNAAKLLSFRGYPENLLDRSLLEQCNHIILATEKNTDKAQHALAARLALIAEGVPANRFVVAVSTVSLDASDKNTGYFNSARALSESAYWVTESSDGYVRAGLAIDDVQNDYYNPGETYRYVREAIQIMNPAPNK